MMRRTFVASCLPVSRHLTNRGSRYLPNVRCFATMNDSKDKPVAIIGGGAWGLSTALHLNRAGFTDITVFERSPEQPSKYSAAWDLNKIIRAEYEDPFYTKLALEAIKEWKTPLFGPYYHQTGYIVAATGRAPQKAVDHLEKALSSIESDPTFAPGIKRLNGSKDFKDLVWQFSGPLTGFKGYFNSLAGYGHSSDALVGIWKHCASRGVKFHLGEEAGRVVGLVGPDGSSSSSSAGRPSGADFQVTGVQTADGRTHAASVTICALGAAGASLVPGLGRFTTARSWSVAHVQLSGAEADLLRGLPVTNVRDLGFFFEPDPATRLFKLCPLGAGYANTGDDGVSLPPTAAVADEGRRREPRDFIPAADEAKLRTLLRETFPWMADRPFVEKRLCWFADTLDSDYCIDFVPGSARSLVALSGDSGHGFKMMPVFGSWVVSLLEKGEQEEPRWKWRDADLRGRDWGQAVSWRIGEGKELKDLIEESDKVTRARL